MKIKKNFIFIVVVCVLTLIGCNNTSDETISKLDTIPFADNQLYAVAYLGYEEIDNLEFYREKYIDEGALQTHYFSVGEYYLVIPRFEDMHVRLYRNDFDTMDKILTYECADSQPFIIQCNISDIFSDVTIEISYQGETVEFSPYISLKDGSVVIGDRGLNITQK